MNQWLTYFVRQKEAPHYFEIKMKGKRNSFVFPDKLGQLVPGEIQKNNQPT